MAHKYTWHIDPATLHKLRVNNGYKTNKILKERYGKDYFHNMGLRSAHVKSRKFLENIVWKCNLSPAEANTAKIVVSYLREHYYFSKKDKNAKKSS